MFIYMFMKFIFSTVGIIAVALAIYYVVVLLGVVVVTPLRELAKKLWDK